MAKTIRVAIVDDHPLMLEGISQILRNSNGHIEVVATGSTAEDAIAIVGQHGPDVLLLDVSIPGGGIEAAYAIGMQNPSCKIIMLTVSERPSHVTAAFDAGARGYLLKGVSGAELVRAIGTVQMGNTYITPELAGQILAVTNGHGIAPEPEAHQLPLTSREESIANLVAQGKTNKEIAEQMDLKEKTIKHYMTNIFQKLQVRNRVEAVIAIRTIRSSNPH